MPIMASTPLRACQVQTPQGPVTYHVRMLPAFSEGLEIATKLAGLLAGPVGALVAGGVTEESEVDVHAALSELGAKLLSGEVPGLLRRLLFDVQKEVIGDKGGVVMLPVPMDIEFAQNYGALAELVRFALVENFGTFFSAGPGAALTSRLAAGGLSGKLSLPTG
jgi:hypothetical protein